MNSLAWLWVFIITTLLTWSCQTVGDQAPSQLRTAEKALDEAASHDAERLVPSAYQAAEQKLERSVELLIEAADHQKSGEETRANSARQEAIKLADNSTAISRGATKLLKDMREFDKNSGKYLAQSRRTEDVIALEAENKVLKSDLARLRDEYKDQTAANMSLQARPDITKIPSNFKVAKAIAYFASGQTILDEKYRPEILELASFLKENEDVEIKLEGFTDARGPVALNNKLAAERIDAVKREFVAQGVAPDRIKTRVIGKVSASATGASKGALQLDRKVTATVYALGH